MNSNEYQGLAARTLIDGPKQPLTAVEVEMAASLLKLHAALGQITERFKKQVLHRHGSYDWGDFLSDLKQFSESNLLEDSYLFRRQLLVNQDIMVLWNVIGLLGESSEVAELLLNWKLEPTFPDASPENLMAREAMSKWSKELGDVAWYHAAIATKLGLTLEDIQQGNIEKLDKRFPEGFTTEDSKARVDVKPLAHILGQVSQDLDGRVTINPTPKTPPVEALALDAWDSPKASPVKPHDAPLTDDSAMGWD